MTNANDSFKVEQFACYPLNGHAIYEHDLEAGGAFFSAHILSAHDVPTTIKSVTVHARITVEGESTFDGDLDAVVELDALEPGQADVIQWVVPNRLLVADGFQAISGDVAVEITLTVVHGAKDKTPVVFVHNVSMQMISARPIPPEINVQFRAV